jgi:hypothetical protein
MVSAFRQPHRRRAIVTGVFSTITSPVFSELVIIPDCGAPAYLHREVTFFEALREMNEIRPFKLVFSLEGSEYPNWETLRRELTEALGSATAKGLFDFLDSPPTFR